MKKLTLLALILTLLPLAGCAPDPNEDFIQGTWTIIDESGGESSNIATKYFEWEFRNGMFYREQEVDPRNIIQSQGSYRVIESDGDVILLELFDIQGERFTYENTSVEVKIEIDREQDTIRLGNMLFERAMP